MAEQYQEQSLELITEYHVDDEVNTRVNGHQQVAGVDQVGGHVGVQGLLQLERLYYVDDEGEQVAHEEDGHHAQEHRRQADLALLQPGEALPLLVRLQHLQQRQFRNLSGVPATS